MPLPASPCHSQLALLAYIQPTTPSRRLARRTPTASCNKFRFQPGSNMCPVSARSPLDLRSISHHRGTSHKRCRRRCAFIQCCARKQNAEWRWRRRRRQRRAAAASGRRPAAPSQTSLQPRGNTTTSLSLWGCVPLLQPASRERGSAMAPSAARSRHQRRAHAISGALTPSAARSRHQRRPHDCADSPHVSSRLRRLPSRADGLPTRELTTAPTPLASGWTPWSRRDHSR